MLTLLVLSRESGNDPGTLLKTPNDWYPVGGRSIRGHWTQNTHARQVSFLAGSLSTVGKNWWDENLKSELERP